ncbi:MAG: phosphate-starvation-inducible rane protein PsiE [Streptosporangiaceae bacterium]|nr:phosphate-starvation-inducible rane protein PsiE [Streptosporangiaceae bacterium]
MSRRTDPAADSDPRNRADALALRVLVWGEHALLYLVSIILLIAGGGILVVTGLTVARSHQSWAERFVITLEGLLLILIVLEIFVTVLTHLEGGRLMLEPFLIVGVIAVIRHILSIVVRLTLPGGQPAESRDQLIELGVYAGVVFVLVAALALSRRTRRADDPPAPAHAPAA